METRIQSTFTKNLSYETTPWSYSSSEEEEVKKPYKIRYIQNQVSSSSESSIEDDNEAETLKAFERKLTKEYYRNQCNIHSKK
jgi:hypothetical protein